MKGYHGMFVMSAAAFGFDAWAVVKAEFAISWIFFAIGVAALLVGLLDRSMQPINFDDNDSGE